MAENYPSYLQGDEETHIVLSSNATRILKLQEEGLSASEIAAMLKLSEATVKYHNKETYRKLGCEKQNCSNCRSQKKKADLVQ